MLAMVLILYLSKAYDKPYWLYLKILLIHIGFHSIVINWLMGCVSSCSFVVLFNKPTSSLLTPTSGLIQGSLLSPYLFSLVVEGRSMAMNLKELENAILFTNGSLVEGKR